MTERTRRIIAGPFNRVEGDLEIRLDIADGEVGAAYVNSPLFRGFEQILEGKDPRDALTIVPRICGICSVSQSIAAATALAAAQGIAPPPNGERVAAIIHAAENVADHLTHFHVFFMTDFARAVYANEPWHAEVVEKFKAKGGTLVGEAMAARSELLHIMGILAGKWPHTLSLQPGGVTKAPDQRDRVRLLAIIRQ
ncbi:MAG TPA: nickel-dependent hydrogenase large subunit, partial [Hyphomicrobium sp.]|nr:nickel-dependent hydrogenase large subunit [Hyphomicrobium sp.]